MMKYSFQDVIAKIEHNLDHVDNGYDFPLTPTLNQTVGNLTSGLYTVVAGLPGAGVTSFVDQNYVLGPLLQWYNDTNVHKRDIKILYFSTITGEIKKIQQLICLFSRLIHGIHVDIPTLNSKPGRLYDLTEEEAVIDSLKIAKVFFDDVLDQQLTVVTGQLSPTQIHNRILDELDKVDRDNTDFMVVVDSSTHLKDDMEKFGTVTGKELDKKMDRYIEELTRKEDIIFTMLVHISPSLLRHTKETEPHYSQLGAYITNCSRGIIIYNPLAEKHPNYIQDSKKFVNHNGLNTLRTWTVVRNTEGKELVERPLLFLPGTGFMVEIDRITDITEFEDVKELLQTPDTSPYYGSMELPEAVDKVEEKDDSKDYEEDDDPEAYEPMD